MVLALERGRVARAPEPRRKLEVWLGKVAQEVEALPTTIFYFQSGEHAKFTSAAPHRAAAHAPGAGSTSCRRPRGAAVLNLFFYVMGRKQDSMGNFFSSGKSASPPLNPSQTCNNCTVRLTPTYFSVTDAGQYYDDKPSVPCVSVILDNVIDAVRVEAHKGQAPVQVTSNDKQQRRMYDAKFMYNGWGYYSDTRFLYPESSFKYITYDKMKDGKKVTIKIAPMLRTGEDEFYSGPLLYMTFQRQNNEVTVMVEQNISGGGGVLTASMVLAREALLGHRDVDLRRKYNALRLRRLQRI